MNAPFRLYGAELSPYSVKVRAYLRFKGLDFEWLERTLARQEEFARYAKLPLAPILVDAEDNAVQDSTPMMEALEAAHPEPSVVPGDAAVAFIAALLEDYADEWLNKAMFHYRWSYPDDQESAARRLTDMLFAGGEAPEGAEQAMKARMIGRLHHVGSSGETAPVIEASFTRLLGLLEALAAKRAYLLGERPSMADFGLYGQLKQLLSDPTPGALIRERAPALTRWIERMENPSTGGAFASLSEVQGELTPLLRDEVAITYLPWMAANAEAVASDAVMVSAELGGAGFAQKPQRYAAKALAELRRKYAAAAEAPGLAGLMAECGCTPFLAAAAESDDDAEDEGED
ncbi:MAG: glutathione S-transferase family protein [Hyphomonadaceae bacterium]